MLISLTSSQAQFKPVYFHPGFNIIVAERAASHNDEMKSTRNGAGKTTIIEILHFCLGASAREKTSIFRCKELEGWDFTLTLEIGGKTLAFTRYTNNVGRIYCAGTYDFSAWPPSYDEILGQYYVTPKALGAILLQELFGGLSDDQKYKLSARNLLSYLIRRVPDGFRNPFEFMARQEKIDIQLSNAYFLDLNLDYAVAFQQLRDQEKSIKDVKNAVKSGIIKGLSFNVGEVHTQAVLLEDDMTKCYEQLRSFRVHPQYEQIEREVNELTTEIHNFTNELVIARQLLSRYQTTIEEERKESSLSTIQSIYETSGLLFGENVRQNLQEVLDFHEQITQNRKKYLTADITRLSQKIDALNGQISVSSERRASAMRILETHGALSEYTLLQERYVVLKQRYEATKERLKDAQIIEDSRSQLKIDREQLLLKVRRDYNERMETLNKAISLFKEITETLYQESGTLTIELDKQGYKFDVEIKSSKSQGIGNMKVFSYDLVILELGQIKARFPDFLVHDSMIFDGVDERQIALALMLAQRKCEQLGVQYICMLNSDTIPYRDLDADFVATFDECVILRLSDETDDGGLLGMRF